MPEDSNTVTSEQIKALRQHYGWTQVELADRLSVTSMSVSNWERGTKAPNPRTTKDLRRMIARAKLPRTKEPQGTE